MKIETCDSQCHGQLEKHVNRETDSPQTFVDAASKGALSLRCQEETSTLEPPGRISPSSTASSLRIMIPQDIVLGLILLKITPPSGELKIDTWRIYQCGEHRVARTDSHSAHSQMKCRWGVAILHILLEDKISKTMSWGLVLLKITPSPGS